MHVLSDAWHRQSGVVRGVLLMCVSTVAFAIMHAAVRYVSSDLPPFQIAFFRNLFGLAFLIPLLVQSKFEMFRTRRIGLHALRGLINIAAMLMFFTALSITPLAKVTALSFTAPIFMAVLSIVVLGEKFRLYRWLAIAAGFLGMLIILRPGFIALDTGGTFSRQLGRLVGRCDDPDKDSFTHGNQPVHRRMDGRVFMYILSVSCALGLATIHQRKPVLVGDHRLDRNRCTIFSQSVPEGD